MYSLSQENIQTTDNLSFSHRHVQPKLYVNSPGDQCEQEADAMADRIAGNETLARGYRDLAGNSVQRKSAGHGANLPASSSFLSSLSSSKGGGSPLPDSTRNFMEHAFSTDFSFVRIHTDSKASHMSEGIQAKAFTHGTDIYFDKGEYAPETHSGKHLLAHELTHVVQQGGDGTKIQRFTNCSTAQDRTINSGLARGRRRSTAAIQLLSEIQGGTNRRAAASLRVFFGTLTPAQITTVRDRIVAADARLNNTAVWQCDTAATFPQCGGTDNWCAGTLCPTTTEPTHLCPSFISDFSGCAEPSMAMGFIHEALRAAGACGGFSPPGNRTSPASLDNVFSYTQFIYNNT